MCIPGVGRKEGTSETTMGVVETRPNNLKAWRQAGSDRAIFRRRSAICRPLHQENVATSAFETKAPAAP